MPADLRSLNLATASTDSLIKWLVSRGRDLHLKERTDFYTHKRSWSAEITLYGWRPIANDTTPAKCLRKLCRQIRKETPCE